MSFILGTVSTGVINAFNVLERICLVVLAVLALVLVVLVFMQITGGDTSNVITGNKDSYYSQNKSGSREGRITRLICICVGLIAFFSVLYFLFLRIPTWL